MPNWCYNQVFAFGSESDLEALATLVADPGSAEEPGSAFTFERIVPTAHLDQSNWYEDHIQHWGTKWDAAGPKVTADLELPGVNSWQVSFDTAWSPPEPIICTLVEKFPSLTFVHQYSEEGMAFAGVGVFKDGKLLYHVDRDEHVDVAFLTKPGCVVLNPARSDEVSLDCAPGSEEHAVSEFLSSADPFRAGVVLIDLVDTDNSQETAFSPLTGDSLAARLEGGRLSDEEVSDWFTQTYRGSLAFNEWLATHAPSQDSTAADLAMWMMLTATNCQGPDSPYWECSDDPDAARFTLSQWTSVFGSTLAAGVSAPVASTLARDLFAIAEDAPSLAASICEIASRVGS